MSSSPEPNSETPGHYIGPNRETIDPDDFGVEHRESIDPDDFRPPGRLWSSLQAEGANQPPADPVSSFGEAPAEADLSPDNTPDPRGVRGGRLLETGERKIEQGRVASGRADLEEALALFRDLGDAAQSAAIMAELAKPGPSSVGSTEAALPSYFVPGVAQDLDSSPDRLGRGDDARAIAGLIASTALQPPLAIGLFGAWGSGKTHFMHQISREIGAFTTSSSSEMHRQVREITFNAWHYAEHNLWASLLQHVWATLSPRPGWKEEQLTAALATVEGAQRVTEEAKARASAAEAAVDTARAQVKQATEAQQHALAEAAQLRGADMLDIIELTEESLGGGVASEITALQKAADVARVDVNLATPKGLTDALSAVRSVASTASSLTITAPWWQSPLIVGAAVLVVLGGLGILLGQLAHDHSAWLGNAVVGVTQLLAVVGGAVGWVTRRAHLVKQLLTPTATLQARVDARVAKAKEETQAALDGALRQADTATGALAQAQAQLAAAQLQQDQAKAEVAGLHGVRLLDRYLADRAGANDYQQYLGIVALAHRDLDNLGQFLLEAAHDDEVSGRIDRIVLYIDDLDRCKPETVARVLEAVHLLLALKLFVVVVGVDRGWLDRSLLGSHQALLAQGADTSPRDYLDKIFHLTYTLPAMTDDGAQRLLRALLPSPGLAAHSADGGPTGASLVGQDDTPSTTPVEVADVLAALQISDADRSALDRVTPLLTSSPRRVSRFLSTYLVLRARAVSSALPLRQEQADTVTALAVLVALIFGVPSAAAELLEQTSSVDEQPLGQWLIRWLDLHSVDENDQEAGRVVDFLKADGSWADLKVSDLWVWWPVAQPYTSFALSPEAQQP